MFDCRLVMGALIIGLLAGETMALEDPPTTTQTTTQPTTQPTTLPTTAPVRRVDPQANKILQRAAAYLRNADSFQFDVTTVAQQNLPTTQYEIRARSRVQFARPNRLAIRNTERQARSDGKPIPLSDPVRILCDGNTLWFMKGDSGDGIRRIAPADLDNFMFILEDVGLARGIGFGGVLSIGALIHSDMHDMLTRNTTEIEYVGQVEHDGVMCDKVRCVTPEPIVIFWIESDDTPVIRRIDFERLFARTPASEELQRELFTFVETFDHWRVGELGDKDAFTLQSLITTTQPADDQPPSPEP